MQQGKPKELGVAVPIMPMPFDQRENIDEEELRGLVEFVAKSGFTGICLPAYDRKFYKFTDEKLLPFTVFGLQNFELWLYCEKRVPQARGLMVNPRCGSACISPDPHSLRYVDELIDRVVQALKKAGLSAKAV